MPTYEYECPKCGVFETFHAMSTSLDNCPECGSTVERLISGCEGLIFKGAGFHVNSYPEAKNAASYGKGRN